MLKKWLVKIGGSLFVLVSFFLVVLSGPACGNAADYIFDSLRFFEEGQKLPDDPQYQFSKSFSNASTRYVWCLLTVKNLAHNLNEHSHEVTWRYYYPDGTLMGEQKSPFIVKPEWEYAWIPRGWGWETPGKWQEGTYTAEVKVDGIIVGRDTFQIDNSAAAESGLELQSIRFYEGAYEAPKNNDRVFTKRFPKSTTRYIYFSLLLKNLLKGKQQQKPAVKARYYSEDGSLFGEPVINAEIPPDWADADIWTGWGWKEPGKWPAGTYRVEFFVEGNKIGEDAITVYDDWMVTSVDPSLEKKKEIKKDISEERVAHPSGEKRQKIYKTAIVEFAERGDLNVKEAGAIIAEWMTSSMIETGVFEVYTRLSIKDILQELEFQSTDFIDEKTAAKAGKIHGVEAIVTGSVIKFGNILSVTVKLIDTETAKIIDSADIKAKSLDALSEKIDDLAEELARE